MIIDCHGHVTAPDALYAYRSILLASRGYHGRGKASCTDEKILAALNEDAQGAGPHMEQLKEVGTDLQLISPRPFMMMHSEKPEKIVQWYTEESNNVIARQCQLFPKMFVGVAGLPQNMGVSPKNCLPELDRCIKELGFVGCVLNPDPTEGLGEAPPPLGDEYWYPLYEKLVQLDVPALIHSCSSHIPRDPYSLHFVHEESMAIVGLLSSNVYQDFPTLKIVVSHGGGAIPYQAGRFMAASYKGRIGNERFEQALRKLYFDTCLYTKDSLELLFKTVGVDRCLFGTERPGTGSAQDPDTKRWMDDIRPLIEDIEWLTPADRKAIYEDNVRALYKLKV